MNKLKLVMIGTLLVCAPTANAGDINGSSLETAGISPAPGTAMPAPVADNTTAGSIQASGVDAKKRRSWWDAILNLFKIPEQKRTAGQAFDNMIENQNVVIDFSNVTDFVQNGDAKMAEYYQKLIATKSFGTKSPNLYVNLSNTGVTLDFVSKWAAQFKKDNKNVVWNLSDNKNLDDSVIDALDFASIYSLNLSGTSVSDSGIAKISAILETSGIGKLVCIHLSGTKVTDAGVTSLKSSIQKAVELWRMQNPGKEYKLQGTDNSGVVFEKIPDFPKRKRPNGALQPAATANTVENFSAAPVATQEVTALPTTSSGVEDGLATATVTDAGAQSQVPEVTIPAEVPQSDVNSMAVMTEGTPGSSTTAVEGAATTALSEADAVIESATTTSNSEVPAVE